MTETRNNDRGRVGEVYDDAKERAIEAYDAARTRAAEAQAKLGDQLADTPLLTLIGGLAVGAVVAALLPATRGEKKLLGPVTDRIRDGASGAFEAAREAGGERLGELGLTRDRGGDAIRTIIDGALDAVKVSAKAAAGSVRGDR